MPSRWTLSLAAELLAHLSVAGIAFAQPGPGIPSPAEPQADPAPTERPAEASTAEGAPERKRVEEEIVVTGTRIRRKDLTTPAPITVINKEQVTASGKVSIGDFLQSLPEQGSAANTSQNNGGNGTTRVALRGLGAARTLVLLNGRRFVAGGTGADDSVDLNSIPTAVIERVEVLKDGASAIYGSDAIAGVINIITRKRLDGTEVAGYVGSSTRGDGLTYDFNATTGIAGDRGNVLFSIGYYQQKPVFAGDRDFSKVPLAYDGSGLGPAGRIGPYNQGSGTAPAGTFVLPPSQRGDPRGGNQLYARLMAACRTSLAYPCPNVSTYVRDPNIDPNLFPEWVGLGWRPFRSTIIPPEGDGYNFQPENYLVTPQTRISLFTIGERKIGNAARAYFESSFVNRRSDRQLAAEPLSTDGENLFVSAKNYYNPFGVDLTAVRRRLLEFDHRVFKQDVDTFRVVVGVDGTLPDSAGPLHGWFWDISFNYGRTSDSSVKQGNLLRTGLQDALGPSWVDASGTPHCGTDAAHNIEGCVPLDLFHGGDPPTITRDQVANLTFTGTSKGTNELVAAQLNTSGELFKLFAERPVGLAAGYEYRIVSGQNIPDPITVAGLTTGNKGQITRGHYYLNEGYAELSIPIVSEVQFAREIEATAAARAFSYNNFGKDITYKFGGRWSPIPDFTIRGTYSTAFRAPSTSELFQGLADAFPNVKDPCRGPVTGGPTPVQKCVDQGAANNGDTRSQLRSQLGGNEDLKPETAKIFTLGIVFEPTFIRNFTLTADYFQIKVDQRIAALGAGVILGRCYSANPNEEYCDKIRRDPNTHLITNMIDHQVNVGNEETSGIDLGVNYSYPTTFGRFAFLFDGTYLRKYNRTLADGTVAKARGTFDLGNTGGTYPAFKYIAGLRYNYQGFGAGLNTRFLGSFHECGDPSGDFSGAGKCYIDSRYQRKVSAYSTYDAFLTYSFNSTFGKTTVSAGINNFLDQKPAVIYNGFTAASDPQAYADGFIGRFIYGRFAQAF